MSDSDSQNLYLENNGMRQLRLSPQITADLREHLPTIGVRVVRAITAEVPDYQQPFQGRMGEVIESAVAQSLNALLEVTSGASRPPADPLAPALQGARQLGRDEARRQRPIEVLLAAYRVGARVSWHEISRELTGRQVSTTELGLLAEAVFTFIDELSAASVTGHREYSSTTQRAAERLLDRVARLLLHNASSPETLRAAALAAGWTPPRTVTAVVGPSEVVTAVARTLDPRTLLVQDDLPASHVVLPESTAVALVPDAGGAARHRLLEIIGDQPVLVGPARAWQASAASYHRAVQVWKYQQGLSSRSGPAAATPIAVARSITDADALLPELLATADPVLAQDLRDQTLAPLQELTPGARERLSLTLQWWLLLQGRREEVAARLHVHPQTVRYRMQRLRELFGDQLQDPRWVCAAVMAFGPPPVTPSTSATPPR